MLLRFTKMHGLGNDFMVIDLVTQHAQLSARQIRQWADRHTGVGFDQLLLVEPPTTPDADFRYRIFNADGSEVEQCGNGARCFARFVQDKRLTAKQEIHVETAGGPIVLRINRDRQVTVDMGAPRFVPAEVPFQADAEAIDYTLEVAGETLQVAAVSMGNPHCVTLVPDVQDGTLERLGWRLTLTDTAEVRDRRDAARQRRTRPRVVVVGPGRTEVHVWVDASG